MTPKHLHACCAFAVAVACTSRVSLERLAPGFLTRNRFDYPVALGVDTTVVVVVVEVMVVIAVVVSEPRHLGYWP